MLKRNIIIILSIVVVIAAAIVAINFIEDASDSYGDEQPEIRERIFVLGDESDTAVVLLVEVLSELGSYTVVNTNPHEETPHRFTLAGFEEFDLLNNSLVLVANSARRLMATEVLFDGDADLAGFGLANPAATISVSYLDGSSTVLLIGDTAPGGNQVYVAREGEQTIYLISSTDADRFLRRELDFVNTVITEDPAPEGIPDIASAVLGGNVRPEPILIERAPQPEPDQFILHSHLIVSPIQRRLHMSFGLEPLVHSFGLVADSIEARFDSSEELVQWGLDEPYSTLEVTTSTSESFKLMASVPDENGTVYLVREGMPFVYSISSDSIPWLRLTYFDMMDDFLIMPHVDSISTIELHLPEWAAYITLEGEGENLEVFVDGIRYEAEDGVDAVRNFRLLYQDFIVTHIDSIPDESMLSDMSSFPEILRIVYNYRDGSPPDSITFFEGPARRVFVQLNDEMPMLVLSSFVDHLLRSIDSFLAGERVVSYFW